ncbi:MAG: general secretion pathway protein GspK [Gemmatimonadaceae bacterium]|nr:general secretion pathway protein GspK [Gemmatimonadaceae bacterium]
MIARRGVALVLVLWLVVILGGIGALVVRDARTSSALAGNVRAAAVARFAAESGLEATIAEIERRLAAMSDTVEAGTYLNGLAGSPRDSIMLGDGRAAVAIDDPSTRLDVNEAPEANLAALLSRVGEPGRATATARAIRRWIERAPASTGDGRLQPGPTRFVTPLRSLDALREVPGVDVELVTRAAPYLTIDGDGTVNVTAASDTVLGAAFGERRTTPSRLLLISRGWFAGHPLTHEIQGAYAISGTRLVLVHWRERSL